MNPYFNKSHNVTLDDYFTSLLLVEIPHRHNIEKKNYIQVKYTQMNLDAALQFIQEKKKKQCLPNEYNAP